MPTAFSWSERLEFLRGLPTKRTVTSLIAFHEHELVVVKPTYRDGWLLPGGVVEENESPAAACLREVKEELGLDVVLRRLVLVDHISDPGDGRGDSLHFWFSTDELEASQIAEIVLPPHEIAEYRLVEVEEALTLLVPRQATRLRTFVAQRGTNDTLYTENGAAVVPR